MDFQALFESLPGTHVVFLPDAPEYTIVAASGTLREQVLGRGAREAFPGRNLHRALDRVLATAKPDGAATVPVLDSDGRVRYIVHSAGAGSDAERELSTFRQLAENSVIGLMIGSPEGELSYANGALLDMLGYTREDLDSGLLRWDRLSAPGYAEQDAECRRQVAATGRCAPYEKVWIARDGRRIPVLLGAAALEQEGNGRRIAGFVLDISERKRNRRDAFLLRLEDATRPLSDPGEIVRTASRLLCEYLRADRCMHRRLDPDGDHFETPWESPAPDTGAGRGRHRLSDFGAEAGASLRSGLPFVVNDIETDPRTSACVDFYRAVSARSLVSAPLLKQGKLVGTVVVHNFQTRVWEPEEVELIGIVANRCWESRERAEAVRALQTGDQRLRLALRAGRIGTFETFVRENRVVWSPEMEALFGIPESSFGGSLDDWRRLVLPEDDLRIMDEIHRHLERRVPEFAYEFRGIMPTGELRWMRGQTRVFYDAEGWPERLLGVVIDIDSNRRAEANLRRSEQRLRAVFDGTSVYIGLLSPDGVVLEANRALLAMASGITGERYWRIPLFQSRPELEETIRAAIAKAAAGESVRREISAAGPQGEPREFDLSLHPVLNETGGIALIVTETRDITEQKQDKERLRRQWQTFDTVLSNTPDLLYTYDLEGRFTYANRSLISVSQRPLEGTVGKTVFEVGYPPELAGKIFGEIQQVARTGQPFRGQTSFRLPTGEIRHYEYIYVPVTAADGQVEAIAGSTRDVTDRFRAEEQERTREAQLRETARFESLGVMAGGIAHDFNNLLVGVLGNASLLEESVAPRERPFVREIMLAAERAAELTGQMLAYSGKGRFITEVIDIKKLIAENLALLRASLSRNVSVNFETAGEPCFTRGDRAQIHQVVLNLLINASEAIGDRPGSVSIRVIPIERSGDTVSPWFHSPVAAGRYAQIEVRDTGCGMSPEVLARIFDPFFTTKFTGRGLGLAATLGIVKGHKGDIEVESSVGQGTVFRVLLPSCERPAPPPAKAAEFARKAPAEHTILVVDDEETVRKMATAALESRGFRVVTAADGAEALETLRVRGDISLVILDLTMPVMTGEEALPRIHAIDPRLPVVLSTGFGEVEVARRFPSSQVAGVLQKPYSIAALLARVSGALRPDVSLTASSDPGAH
jgi:PAS domain S-box-containing protein